MHCSPSLLKTHEPRRTRFDEPTNPVADRPSLQAHCFRGLWDVEIKEVFFSKLRHQTYA